MTIDEYRVAASAALHHALVSIALAQRGARNAVHADQHPRRSFAVSRLVAVVVDFREASVCVASQKHGSVPLVEGAGVGPPERMLFDAVAWPPRRLTRALARMEAARAWCERVGATRRREMEHVFAAQAEHARRVAALVAEEVLCGRRDVIASPRAVAALRGAGAMMLLTAAEQITRGDPVAFDDQGNVIRAADPATAVGYANADADPGRNIEVAINTRPP